MRSYLKDCKELDIWPKLNVLLYPGETFDTLKQTLEWLESHKSFIKGLSVGPFILFKGNYSLPKIIKDLENLGSHLVSRSSLDINGYADVNLSNQISNETAKKLSINISKSFMSSMDYYDLKAFNYFPRSFDYNSFLQLARSADQALLPFSC